MEKQSLAVPFGIRYVSQWTDYSLKNFEFPHILDKKIPGCGFTEYALTCNIPIVLCSPRRMLLENKKGQHESIFYFKNEDFDSVNTSKDLTKIHRDTSQDDLEINKERIQALYQELSEYILHCQIKNNPPKILVTYDSFRLVRDYLEKHNLFNQFYVVVDEWQSIFIDSRFKSSSELEFLDYLRDITRLCFVSATPMIEDYLKMMPEFKDLPYFEFDWETEDPLRVSSPDLKVRVAKSIQSSAKVIIDEYKSGKFEEYSFKDDMGLLHTIVSNEAVLFVNSVVNIISIIKGNGLTPEECNILCSRTSQNEKLIKTRLGAKFRIGSIPLRGESHKMFTFCTRTVYLGADFYSLCARTFIFSDANVDSLAVDISLDLPQILGRQRLVENPWKNRAELYYKTSRTEKSREEFEEILKHKREVTMEKLENYSAAPHKLTAARDLRRITDTVNYKDDYVAVNGHSGSTLIPVFNELVYISEKRAFDIQQIDYKDRFSVFNTLLNSGAIDKKIGPKITEFLAKFNTLPTFYEKMKYLCEETFTEEEIVVILDQVPLTYKTYYNSLGPARLKANWYNITNIAKEFSMLKINKEDLFNSIYLSFEVGKSYTKSYIKEKMRDIYESLEYKKTPKASDLEEYFEIKPCTITDKETGKRDNGFKIIAKK